MAFPAEHSHCPVPAYNAGWDGLSDKMPSVARVLARHGFAPTYRELHLECATPHFPPTFSDRVKRNLAEYQLKVSQEVISDDEIAYRIGEIDRISAILPRLNLLSFQHRRRLIELFNITIILGVDEERQYVEILWYGDSDRRWLYDEQEGQQLE